MIKKIITDREYLSKVSSTIIDGDELTELFTDLIDTASVDYEGTAGLAAIQIGYPVRAFLLKLNGKFIPILNPEITKVWGGMVTKSESCLSVPGKSVKKRRYKRVRLKFFDYRNGKQVEFNFKGFIARVIAHEMDHLNGKVI